MNSILTLVKGDIKNIKRDLILFATIFGGFGMALFLRFVIPIVSKTLLEKVEFNLSPYYPLIIGVALLIIPMLIGVMTGFMLLENKEEGMFSYYSITPLGKEKYILYRLALPILLNLIISMFTLYFSNLIEIEIFKGTLLILMASLEGVILALVLVNFCQNRVDGLALSKVIGFFFIIPVIDRCIDFKFNFILGISPTYWVPKGIQLADSSKFYLIIILGFLIHILFAVILYRRLNKNN